MKLLSNTQFTKENHGVKTGILWPVITIGNKKQAKKGWTILGWCKNPPFDNCNRGFAILFECIKDSDEEVEPGEQAWFHYSKKSLSEFGIVTRSLGPCQYINYAKECFFRVPCGKPGEVEISYREDGKQKWLKPFCLKCSSNVAPYKKVIVIEAVIVEAVNG